MRQQCDSACLRVKHWKGHAQGPDVAWSTSGHVRETCGTLAKVHSIHEVTALRTLFGGMATGLVFYG